MKKIVVYSFLVFFNFFFVKAFAQNTNDTLNRPAVPAEDGFSIDTALALHPDQQQVTDDTLPKKEKTVRSKSNDDKFSTLDRQHVSDSVLRKRHNPTIAGCLSIIPGGGQIYNRKYWKLPIVYTILGVSSYLVYNFASQMVSYKNEFICRRDGITDKLNPDYALYTDENVLALRSQYRRYMEIAVAATAALYLLNIVDAVVDAHLFYFDISDDLSMNLYPQIHSSFNNNFQRPSLQYGMGITLNLK